MIGIAVGLSSYFPQIHHHANLRLLSRGSIAQGVDLRGKRILELGSGPGALAIACAARGAATVASDAPWVTPLARANAALPANAELISGRLEVSPSGPLSLRF
jgi:predicted nicotinamide N-methyase